MPDLSRVGASVPILLDYLYWLRDRVLAAAAGLEGEAFRTTPVVGSRDLRATLAHELDVEWSWRRRLRDDAATYDRDAAIEPGEFPELADLADRWRADEAEMRAWLDGLPKGELEQPVRRNGLEGFPLSVYLLHVIQHGVTELATAAAILHGLGRTTGDLGLLDAMDDLAPMPRPDVEAPHGGDSSSASGDGA
jgi:uncharacterized damage-inducible protein DinB